MVGARSDGTSDGLFGRGVPGWQCEECGAGYVLLNGRLLLVERSDPMHTPTLDLTRRDTMAACSQRDASKAILP
jgi:hypothetical protein